MGCPTQPLKKIINEILHIDLHWLYSEWKIKWLADPPPPNTHTHSHKMEDRWSADSPHHTHTHTHTHKHTHTRTHSKPIQSHKNDNP